MSLEFAPMIRAAVSHATSIEEKAAALAARSRIVASRRSRHAAFRGSRRDSAIERI
jgi:hypothetical protein